MKAGSLSAIERIEGFEGPDKGAAARLNAGRDPDGRWCRFSAY